MIKIPDRFKIWRKQERAKHIYIAGPMRGYAKFNFPAFHEAESLLVEQGWTCFNPARRDEIEDDFDCTGTKGTDEELEEMGFDLHAAMYADMTFICNTADGIYMLKGWQRSPGAMAEHFLAAALDLEMLYQ